MVTAVNKIFIISDNLDKALKIAAYMTLYMKRYQIKSDDILIAAPKDGFDDEWFKCFRLTSPDCIRLCPSIMDNCNHQNVLEFKYIEYNLKHPSIVAEKIVNELQSILRNIAFKRPPYGKILVILAFLEDFPAHETFLDRFVKFMYSLANKYGYPIGDLIEIYTLRYTFHNIEITKLFEKMGIQIRPLSYVLHDVVNIVLELLPTECSEDSHNLRIRVTACIPNDLCTLLDFYSYVLRTLEDTVTHLLTSDQSNFTEKKKPKEIFEKILSTYIIRLTDALNKAVLRTCGYEIVNFFLKTCDRVQPCIKIRHLFRCRCDKSALVKKEQESEEKHESTILLNFEATYYTNETRGLIGLVELKKKGGKVVIKRGLPPCPLCSPLDTYIEVPITLDEKSIIKGTTDKVFMACIESKNAEETLSTLTRLLGVDKFYGNTAIKHSAFSIVQFDINTYPCSLADGFRRRRCQDPPSGKRLLTNITLEVRIRTSYPKDSDVEQMTTNNSYDANIRFLITNSNNVPQGLRSIVKSLTEPPKSLKELHHENKKDSEVNIRRKIQGQDIHQENQNEESSQSIEKSLGGVSFYVRTLKPSVCDSSICPITKLGLKVLSNCQQGECFFSFDKWYSYMSMDVIFPYYFPVDTEHFTKVTSVDAEHLAKVTMDFYTSIMKNLEKCLFGRVLRGSDRKWFYLKLVKDIFSSTTLSHKYLQCFYNATKKALEDIDEEYGDPLIKVSMRPQASSALKSEGIQLPTLLYYVRFDEFIKDVGEAIGVDNGFVVFSYIVSRIFLYNIGLLFLKRDTELSAHIAILEDLENMNSLAAILRESVKSFIQDNLPLV